jgi:hypothetical protein
MKRKIIGLKVLFLLAALLAGCIGATDRRTLVTDDTGHRLIRISFRDQTGTFRIRLNRGPVEQLGIPRFTNTITEFHLEYGDFVVWESGRNDRGLELSQPEGVSSWWSQHLTRVRASFYCIRTGDLHDFFRTPIYHWRAPADKPRPVSGAAFYADGQLVGEGASGFRALLCAFRKEPHRTFILAPRIKNEGSASPWLAFEQLDAWAQESGAKDELEASGPPAELLDFARLMDGE